MTRCRHDAGWYVRDARVYLTSAITGQLTNGGAIMEVWQPTKPNRSNRLVATCNAGCGAERNIYLEADQTIKVGKIRKGQP